ncbi:MAG: hypothetical protein ABI742_13375 [Gemmatimonadota bacterium]
MRTRILSLAALFLALEGSVAVAQNYALPANLTSASAAAVVDRLLAGREALALTADHASRLTVLSTRLHHDRGRAVVTGLDRVPGKSVPRTERIKTTATEAFRQASAILSPTQQAAAARLLDTPRR